MSKRRSIAAGLFAAALVIVPACGDDEDGDGAELDEEIGDIGDTVEDIGDDIGEEIDEGTEELDDE